MKYRSPVYDVIAVPIEKVRPNDYNPNKVPPPEMKLLYESIKEDGYTMPVVCYYSKSQDVYLIVDGFHRYQVMMDHPDIYEREQGLLPVSIIKKPLDKRIASTVRHNRARGSHDVDLMSNIVKELHELGRSDAWISKHLGMDRDEVLRLKQITGLASLFKDVNFGEAWRPVEEETEKEKIDYELVFVDDGSKDLTWNKIEKICNQNKRITGVHFSRNFGKESAIFAGLANAAGDCCVVMDCDLQHPPETVVEMYRFWEQGYEVVEGVKKSRGKESVLHKASAGLFYKMMSKAVKLDMSRASDFKLMDRKAVEALLAMPERNAFFRALSSWVGYRTTSVEFDVREREAGESKWSTWSLVKYAITNIVAFSTMPMQLVIAYLTREIGRAHV